MNTEAHSNEAARDKVWLIGGTCESAGLALALTAQQIPFVVTVTTDSARRLYPASAQVVVGALNREQMALFLQQQRVACVLDASHPFARVVSEGAIAAAQQTQQSSEIAYLRYERQRLPSSPDAGDCEQVSISTSIEEILNNPKLYAHSVLFTLGQRSLITYASQFIQLRQKSRLFVRILPSQTALAAAIAAGFSQKEIVALRPPISFELEKALWQQWGISLVVAKASGRAGGEAIKRQLAAELGISLWLIERPAIAYPHQTSSTADAIRFCIEQLSPSSSMS